MRIKCGITLGDPSGIGPEIIAKALSRREVLKLADFTAIGDSWVLKKLQPAGCKLRGFKVINIENVSRKRFEFGKLSPEYGRASAQYLNKGIELLKTREIDCLVTAPVNKKAINLSGLKFSGQTEYISKAFAVKDAVMMLMNKKLKVSLVTRHIPLKDVVKHLSAQDVFRTIRNTALGLRSFFAVKNPRIAVCAVNPHGSDSGVMGDEEARLIAPAIAKAIGQGISCEGPYPADTLFLKAAKNIYDCVICMYHDQGLIPLKLTGFQDAVNITLGLPFARTSPGHGTAFDISGKGIADPNSLIEAIKTAVLCAKNLREGRG